MRSSLVIAFYLLLTSSFAQSNTARPFQIKKGFYFKFAQLLDQKPARLDSFTVRERTSGNIKLLGGGLYSFDLVPQDQSEFKRLRKDMVGFSDGDKFYLSDKFTVGGWQGFSVCFLTGPYIIADIGTSAGQYTGGGLLPSLINVSNGYLINIKSRSSSPLTKKALKDLLKKYPELQDKYANQEDLVANAVQILDEINILENY